MYITPPPSSSSLLLLLLLTDGGRGLDQSVLMKYGVGCDTLSFPTDDNRYVKTPCVIFPWMVKEKGVSSGSGGSSSSK